MAERICFLEHHRKADKRQTTSLNLSQVDAIENAMSNYRIIIRQPNRSFDQLGAKLRTVALSGTATWNQLLGDAGSLEPLIREWLENDGFIVNAVRVNKQTLFQNGVNIELELSVYDNFTAEQARINAQNVLAKMTSWWGSFNLFYAVNLKVAADYKTTTNAPSSFPSTTPAKNTNAGGTGANNPTNNPLDYLANALNPTTLFGTTGVTVGVVAAILVLVVILKR